MKKPWLEILKDKFIIDISNNISQEQIDEAERLLKCSKSSSQAQSSTKPVTNSLPMPSPITTEPSARRTSPSKALAMKPVKKIPLNNIKETELGPGFYHRGFIKYYESALNHVLTLHTKQELLALTRACGLPLSQDGDRKKAKLIQILTSNYCKLSLSIEVSPYLPQQTELNL